MFACVAEMPFGPTLSLEFNVFIPILKTRSYHPAEY